MRFVAVAGRVRYPHQAMPAAEESAKASRDSFRVPFSEGQVLGGKFRVNRLLGKGGMGYVIEAEHINLGRRVAIKLLLPEHAKRQEWVTRFMREARAASTLEGDHVVKILDVATLDDSTPYMVMEFLEGVDLARLVDEEGRLEPGEAVAFVLQACRAIEEAHDRGIVHRDLKPGNLFLTHRKDGSPVVKVFDFGISKISQATWNAPEGASITSTLATMGSPHYMSPEQLRSARNVDNRSDIWSLGIILHELITGSTPFVGESLSGVCAAVVADPPAKLRDALPDAPPELERIILWCLEKDPNRRPASVRDLVKALRPFAAEPSSRILQQLGPDEVASREPTTARTLDEPLPMVAPELHDDSLKGLLTKDIEEALPPEYRPTNRSAELETLGHSPTQPMPPPEPPPTWARPPMSSQLSARTIPEHIPEEDEPDRGGAAVWIMIGLAAVIILGGLGLVAYTFLSADEQPVAAPGTSSTPAIVASSAAPADDGQVTLVLEVTPKDALVSVDGAVIEERRLRYPKSDNVHKLVVSAPGYVTSENEFTTSVGGTLVVTLRPQKK